MEAMAVDNGLNPATLPVTSLSNYLQALPTLHEVAENAPDGAESHPWWERGG